MTLLQAASSTDPRYRPVHFVYQFSRLEEGCKKLGVTACESVSSAMAERVPAIKARQGEARSDTVRNKSGARDI
jgi:hypothetical protein